jgi:hypothetical protein
MRLPLLHAHIAMVPRLVAEESLEAAERTAVGTVILTKQSRSDVLASWRKAAEPDRPRARRAPTFGGTADMAKRSGIGVRVVPKRSPS